MPKMNVYKSDGRTVYLCGLRVFRGNNGKIQLAYDKGDKKGLKKDIAHCDSGSDAEKFFERILKSA